jgi:hypothetical protein
VQVQGLKTCFKANQSNLFWVHLFLIMQYQKHYYCLGHFQLCSLEHWAQ